MGGIFVDFMERESIMTAPQTDATEPKLTTNYFTTTVVLTPLFQPRRRFKMFVRNFWPSSIWFKLHPAAKSVSCIWNNGLLDNGWKMTRNSGLPLSNGSIFRQRTFIQSGWRNYCSDTKRAQNWICKKKSRYIASLNCPYSLNMIRIKRVLSI